MYLLMSGNPFLPYFLLVVWYNGVLKLSLDTIEFQFLEWIKTCFDGNNNIQDISLLWYIAVISIM